MGILTFHRSFNYGAFLQCYSLVKKIQKEFPEHVVEVIDYSLDDNIGYKKAIERAAGEKRRFFMNRNQAMLEGLKYLPLSKERFTGTPVKELYEYISANYDMVIIGSDAVFNWNGKGLPNAFLPGQKTGNLRIAAYAASAHGLNYHKASQVELNRVRNSLSLFGYVGVRDCETENMIQACGGAARVEHTCDPTCFLDLDALPVDRNQLEAKLASHNIDLSKPLIGIMAGEPIGRTIKKYFRDKVQLAAVYYPNKYADVYLDDFNQFEWAVAFRYYNVFITHYFHGTLFALKNGTPCIITERNTEYRKNYTTKIGDLLNRLDLNEVAYPMDIPNRSLAAKALIKIGLSDGQYQKGLIQRILPYAEEKRTMGKYMRSVEKEAQEFIKFRDYLASI